ncbi:hypothetical protein M9H77_16493 [Catharanthus roseus]|uniref:Uncharacterized protein n=1 Tax=Catharanthus roseus TaxID=4058 RepID=A0ACC0B1X1_CATRO|nr:hypothetical protein M9H77_16493 [Catharanthus roseus]
MLRRARSSAAYVCGERAGLIPEKPLSMGETMSESYVDLDIDNEKKVADEKLKELENRNASLGEIRPSMKELGFQRIISKWSSYGKQLSVALTKNPSRIPGDMMVNSILLAIVTHSKQSCDHHIYHVGSSLRNPLKYGGVQSLVYQYFLKNPWINDKGKYVKVGKDKVFNSMDKFHIYVATHYIPPLKVLKLDNIRT